MSFTSFLPPPSFAFSSRRQAQAQRNYLTALAALTTLRRLLPITATIQAAIPAATNGADTNGEHKNKARGKFDPRNRIVDLFDPAANGMGPRAGAKHQAPCSTEV
jgi:hypothetical protein